MDINASINALHSISANFNKIPGRINDAILSKEPTEGLEAPLVDMMVDKNAFAANVEVIRTMNTVESMLLDELRDK